MPLFVPSAPYDGAHSCTGRLSVPFVPPAREEMTLEKMVERFPNWGYQLYFREKSTNVDIETKVRQRLCL